MKKSNVRESTISRDTLLITDAAYELKRRVKKPLLECSMGQLYHELVASPDYVGIMGGRHADINYLIISDTMLCSLAPHQLSPMTYNHKMMCGCAICNTSNYLQE